jgi:hypothetical protein
MGTRSLTHVIDNQRTILTLYRQMDGYPDGHGVELAHACNVRVINGIGMGDTYATAANGMGCLAARIVRELKGEDIGHIYVEPPGASDCGEEYVYTVEADKDGQPIISCTNHRKAVFTRLTPAQVIERFATAAA